MQTVLGRLQALLADLYDVDPGCEVGDFVTSDRNCLPHPVRASLTDEHLLVACDAEAVSISLFIDARVLARLGERDPFVRLDGRNLGDCWTALEGVSHFLCVAWNARHDRGVSVLELEMQAEIDKFVVTALLLGRQGCQRFPAELHRLLFVSARVDPQLAGARAGLYRLASRRAAQFCRRVERSMQQAVASRLPAALGIELKRFYRLPDRAKFEYIAQLG